MDLLIQISQLVLILALLVLVHEFGHFMFAKLFKTRVEKFYLFFNPWFSLFKWKKGDTTYGIGWLPLGGYVKISGMIDESMDTDQMEKPPESWEFRSKPAWQRFLIMFGGVMNNFILAIIIYMSIVYTWGTQELPLKDAYNGIYCDSVALNAGFMHGDRIVSINDYEPATLQEAKKIIFLDDVNSVKIIRNNTTKTIILPDDFQQTAIDAKSFFIEHNIPFVISDFIETSVAKKAGMQIGDSIVSVNGKEILPFYDYPAELSKYTNNAITLGYYRNGVYAEEYLMLDSTAKIGAYCKSFSDFYKDQIITKTYTLGESLPKGIELGVEAIVMKLKMLKILFTPAGIKNAGGFKSMAEAMPPVWDWSLFWERCAFFSIILGVMNLLPIPALDGGHIMFVLYEMISGRKPPQKFLEKAQIVGMLLLLTLMVYVNLNDFIR